jgi:hypothetical protein
MRSLNVALAGALIAGVSLIGSAQAAPVGLPDGTRAAIDRLSVVETAHMWGNQDYCWYEDGWNGAGWYQCGYAGAQELWLGRCLWLAWMGCPDVGTSHGHVWAPHDDKPWLLLVAL